MSRRRDALDAAIEPSQVRQVPVSVRLVDLSSAVAKLQMRLEKTDPVASKRVSIAATPVAGATTASPARVEPQPRVVPAPTANMTACSGIDTGQYGYPGTYFVEYILTMTAAPGYLANITVGGFWPEASALSGQAPTCSHPWVTASSRPVSRSHHQTLA